VTKKLRELQSSIASGLQELVPTLPKDAALALIDVLVDSATSVSRPEGPGDRMEMIVMRGPSDVLRTKPGHVRYNMGAFMRAVASGTLAVPALIERPWLAGPAGLLLWQALWDTFTVKLELKDGIVMWAMYQHRDENGLVDNADLPAFVVAEATKGAIDFALTSGDIQIARSASYFGMRRTVK
jgi:hypothetical protein